MKARPYQIECIERIESALLEHNSTLAVLATGLGKTVVFSHVADRHDKRVLVLAHRDELIRQAAEKLEIITGDRPGIEMGEEHVDEQSWLKSRLVVSSVQTMCRPKRQKKFKPEEFGLVIIDEAHHAVARSYRSILAYFQQNPNLKVLGVTATPKRADQLAMGQVFDCVAYEMGIEAAIDEGWLVPVRQQAITVHGLDFSSVRTVAGDFHEGELERILSEEKILHKTVAPLVETAGDLSSLVFCVSVQHARLMALVLDRYKKGSAEYLSGESSPEARKDAVDRFRRGRLQFLCNCNLFLEGFDAPNTSLVVMARPTKSLALYTQILGRGTRPLPGIVDDQPTSTGRREAIAGSSKPYMLALDFVGNSGQHKIITAADLLGGKYGMPIREYARKTMEIENKPVPVSEALERARDELALLEEIRERKRREAIRAGAEYSAQDVNPFAGGSSGSRQTDSQPKEPPTEKQISYLVRVLGWTVDKAMRVSKKQASAIIGKSKAS